MKAKPKRVTWSTDEELECAILGALGFSTKFIMERTGLTHCQVGYRLNKGSIKRADYRNGQSEMAERVLNRSIPSRKSEVRNILHLKEQHEPSQKSKQ